MSDEEIDRIDAQYVADLLGIEVSAIPEDHESLTSQLWDVAGLGDEQMPESYELRYSMIGAALVGGTFGTFGIF